MPFCYRIIKNFQNIVPTPTATRTRYTSPRGFPSDQWISSLKHIYFGERNNGNIGRTLRARYHATGYCQRRVRPVFKTRLKISCSQSKRYSEEHDGQRCLTSLEQERLQYFMFIKDVGFDNDDWGCYCRIKQLIGISGGFTAVVALGPMASAAPSLLLYQVIHTVHKNV